MVYTYCIIILKIISNNWLTDACSELLFYSQEMIAKLEIMKNNVKQEKINLQK